MPVDSDVINNLYKQIEDMRMTLLENIDYQEIATAPELPGAVACLEKDVLKITVNECLPCICNLKGAVRIRNHWLGMIRKALAGINIRFTHALCVIIIYAPSPAVWDADNRAVKFIIDAMRYCRIVPDDTWDNLSYMVTGIADQKRPRTEVYVVEMGKNHTKNILNMALNSH